MLHSKIRKLSISEKEIIRRLYCADVKQTVIASVFDISQGRVSSIVNEGKAQQKLRAIERFFEMYQLVNRPVNECWEWQGALTPDGYGHLNCAGRKVLIHRFVYELTNGTIPDGLCVLHSCNNRKCFNLAHLYLGTRKNNSEYMVESGRSVAGRKLKRLTAEEVEEIRCRYAEGQIQRVIAEAYSVTPHTVYNIVAGRTHRKPLYISN